MSVIPSWAISLLILALFFAILAAVIRWLWTSISRMNEMRKKQNLSVIARWRNKATEALWKDLMDIRIAGIIPVGMKVEAFLYDMFPNEMETLEEMRTKNPIAWREYIKYIAPVLLYIKVNAHYKGQEALDNVIQRAKEIFTGVANPTDQSSVQDSGNGNSGGRTE